MKVTKKRQIKRSLHGNEYLLVDKLENDIDNLKVDAKYILRRKVSGNVATLELDLNAMQNMDYVKYVRQNYYKHFSTRDVEGMCLENVALKLRDKIYSA